MTDQRADEARDIHPFDRLVSWMHSRPDHIRSEFHDDYGGATFSVEDGGFFAESGEAMERAGFAVEYTASGWTAIEPVWSGIPRTGRWESVRCTPATTGNGHDTFEIIYDRETMAY